MIGGLARYTAVITSFIMTKCQKYGGTIMEIKYYDVFFSVVFLSDLKN